MKINHKKVEQLKSFEGVELKGNETFDELLEIEKEQEKKKLIKGTIICKAKKCNNYLYKNQSTSNREYCSDCFQKGKNMTENKNYFDDFAQRQIRKSYFGWLYWADKMNGRLKNEKKKGGKKDGKR